MSPVYEHKVLKEWQRMLEKPAFGTRAQAAYGSLAFVIGALLLSLSILWATEEAVDHIIAQCIGHFGGFLCGVGMIFWVGARQFFAVAPHVSLESIEKRIEELES